MAKGVFSLIYDPVFLFGTPTNGDSALVWTTKVKNCDQVSGVQDASLGGSVTKRLPPFPRK
jgi:hypothetical protein